MKKCPYCAEKIQDEAIVCRYCGRDLPKESIPPAIPLPEEKRESGAGISLLLGILLLVAIYGVGFLIAYTWKGNASDLRTLLGLYQVCSMLLVTLLALSNQDPEKRSFMRGLGLFILSIIPLVGWIVIFMAGQGLARNTSRGRALVILGVIIIILAVSFGSATSGFSLTQATQTPLPTATLWPTATPWPSVSDQWVGCIHGKNISKDYFDQLLLKRTCVYGVITHKLNLDKDGTIAYNIYPLDKPASFIIVAFPADVLQKQIPGALGILTDADTGECIVVVGYPGRQEDGTPLFIASDVRDLPQLMSALGPTNYTVQTISSLCK